MLYDLQQGKNERRILQQARKNNLPIPEAIQNAPALSPGMQYYYGAYVDLTSCRTGMGDGDIPWTAVREYAHMEGMPAPEFKRLWELVKRVDLEYLKFREAQAKKKNKT